MTELADSLESRYFLEYWRVLRSRKETVIAITLVIAISGLILSYLLPRKYEVSTRMTVTPPTTDVAVFERRDADPWYNPFYMKTQLEILESQHVLDQVILRLNLRVRFAPTSGSPLTTKEARAVLKGSMRARPYLDTNIIRIEAYRRSSKDDQDGSDARRQAVDIANTVAQVYSEVTAGDARKKTEGGVRELEKECERNKQMLNQKEDAAEKMRQELGLPGMTYFREETSALERIRLQELESRRLGMSQVMIQKKAVLEKLKELEGDQSLRAVAMLTRDSSLVNLRRDLTEVRLQLADLKKSKAERHPDVMSAEARLGELQREIDEALIGARISFQADYEIAKTSLDALERELEAEKLEDIKGSGERYLPFYKSQQEVKKLKETQDRLQFRLVEEKIKLGMPVTTVTVIDSAEMPDENEYVSPKHLVNLLLSLIMGMACGVGLAFLREYVDTSVKTIEEVERYIGAPVLGVIARKAKPLIEVGERSTHSEAYRILRTNVLFSERFEKATSLCVTSGGAGEGKSLTLANLAYVNAQLGDKTIVVDSDLRRPRQHRIFKLNREPGLSDVLRGDASIESVLQETSMPNLYLVSSGTPTVASAGLLDTQRMTDMLENLRGNFDSILFDAPPIMGVSDASILVRRVDAVLLVIQHRSYPRAMSARAKKLVEGVGGNLLGVVLNNINISRDYYSYYSYSGQYTYGDEERKLARKVRKG